MKRIQTLSLLCILVLLFTSCKTNTPKQISKTGFYFDTVIEITLYNTTDYSIIDNCFSFCNDLEQTVSRTVKSSDIYKLNHAFGESITVSDTTLELIEIGIKYGDLTNGKFDITVAPLVELWDFKNNSGNIPTKKDIESSLSHIDYKNILIENNQITLLDPAAAIDLGGIAKGYMADKLKEYLIGTGIQSALINLGGNILTVGSKPNGDSFHLGIQKPFEKQGVSITSVKVVDSSVVSSGIYERYFKVDDIIYHHILDTNTGYPCENNLLSVTILSENSVDGDALSTACFTLGIQEATSLIKTLKNVEAIFITKDYQIIDTRK